MTPEAANVDQGRRGGLERAGRWMLVAAVVLVLVAAVSALFQVRVALLLLPFVALFAAFGGIYAWMGRRKVNR